MSDDGLTRGGRKLEAALARFGLADRVRGAHAVDVGASTGGFTDVLLRAGAAHVTAIDVGHGQLLERLLRDPRVTSLEKTDFRKLPLADASGPFDLFSVDVSFVAARNMLRALAFRLREGAEGVVLVKPQFELPDHLVRAGKVDDPVLRARALETFRAKAVALGFELVEQVDSPVPGGEGTVEILTHLRFGGRPAHLPQPGEKKPARASTGKRRELPGELTWFAVASPGLEGVLRDEVARLPGAGRVTQVEGGVEFIGGLEVGFRANLHLRIATRVVARLGEVRAREFGKLRHGAAGLPWRSVLGTDLPVKINATASRSRLYHTGAIAEQVLLALRDRIGDVNEAPKGTPEDEGEEAGARLLVRGVDDRFMFSVDASGALLHRRGWRTEAGPAPLRETLAAGMLALAGYDGAGALLDPMCGAGTIPLEAAAIAAGMAPGLGRAFAIERWPAFDAEIAARLREEARGQVKPAPAAPVIFGWDRDAKAIEIARRNAERAGLSAWVHFETATFGDRSPPADAGLVLINPPYGKRLGRGGEAERGLRDLGRALRLQFGGWTVGVLVPPGLVKGLGLKKGEEHRLNNGGLKTVLVLARAA